jgi:CDP-diacylglycerol--glycerol-3-phosphate 3-phosphatidyltransferase
MSNNSTSNQTKTPLDTSSIFNVPNQLTCLRIILAIVMFCFLEFEFYLTGMVLFIIAAGTDWVDGYYARKYGMVTTLGRILDPFADKVIICGAFIYLVASPTMLETPWGLRAWMVVVIIGRELLVTVIRSFIEQSGGDFSAKWSGKWKMVLQCIAAGAGLFYLSYADPLQDAPGWCVAILITSIWAAVVLTVYSGVVYIFAALRMLKES